MAKNPVGFVVTNPNVGWNETDFDDLFIRKDCFLDGGLWVWGFGAAGFLGTNNEISRSSPVQTVSGGTNWKSISLNSGIKTDGTLWKWGQQVGDNTGILRSSPVQTISGGTNWKSASSGNSTVAIKTDGTLWTWGYSSGGILGDNNLIDRSSPVQTISGGSNWKQVSSSGHVAAIKTDGSLWMWGYNSNGELGDNTSINKSSPVQTISGGTNWKQVSVSNNTAAIKTDGTLWTWGQNNFGSLGDNSGLGRLSPVQTISGGTNWKQVNTGKFNTAAIKTDGTLWIWGFAAFGQLGDNKGDAINASSPVQTVSGGTNWKQVLTGYTTAAIKTDGSLWLWGSNDAGALGIGIQTRNAYYSTNNVSSPVQTISGGTNWKTIAFGLGMLAIREGCW